jgi:hypothetical protein
MKLVKVIENRQLKANNQKKSQYLMYRTNTETLFNNAPLLRNT